jgi:His-Xaa-Ser system protein HxsD
MENFSIDKKSKTVTINVNPKIFPLEVIYSAAYVLLNKAHAIIDGDPEKKISIKLKAKKSGNLADLAQEFNDELVNYSMYVVQASGTSGIRQAIINRALGVLEEDEEEYDEENEEAGFDPSEDPLGISKPWSPEMAKGIELPEDLENEEHKDKQKEGNC